MVSGDAWGMLSPTQVQAVGDLLSSEHLAQTWRRLEVALLVEAPMMVTMVAEVEPLIMVTMVAVVEPLIMVTVAAVVEPRMHVAILDKRG